MKNTEFSTSQKPRKKQTLFYDYGNGNYKIVEGVFPESGWVNSSPLQPLADTIINKRASRASSQSRARSRIFELANCNDWDYFITLTYNMKLIDRFSIQDITERMQKLFKAYKRKNKDFQYIVVAELHKKVNEKNQHAIHLHGLCRGVPIDDIKINEHGYYYNSFFNLGYNSFSHIIDKNRISKYITKYITKDSLTFSNGYYYLCSRGLKRALVSAIDLDIDTLSNVKQFDYVKIFDLDLTNKNDNNINKENCTDIITIMRSKEVNTQSVILGSFADCVKLRFPELYKKGEGNEWKNIII